MDDKINKKLHELLNELGIEWGILIFPESNHYICSKLACSKLDYGFVNRLHEKLWEGCPIVPSTQWFEIPSDQKWQD